MASLDALTSPRATNSSEADARHTRPIRRSQLVRLPCGLRALPLQQHGASLVPLATRHGHPGWRHRSFLTCASGEKGPSDLLPLQTTPLESSPIEEEVHLLDAPQSWLPFLQAVLKKDYAVGLFLITMLGRSSMVLGQLMFGISSKKGPVVKVPAAHAAAAPKRLDIDVTGIPDSTSPSPEQNQLPVEPLNGGAARSPHLMDARVPRLLQALGLPHQSVLELLQISAVPQDEQFMHLLQMAVAGNGSNREAMGSSGDVGTPAAVQAATGQAQADDSTAATDIGGDAGTAARNAPLLHHSRITDDIILAGSIDGTIQAAEELLHGVRGSYLAAGAVLNGLLTAWSLALQGGGGGSGKGGGNGGGGGHGRGNNSDNSGNSDEGGLGPFSAAQLLQLQQWLALAAACSVLVPPLATHALLTGMLRTMLLSLAAGPEPAPAKAFAAARVLGSEYPRQSAATGLPVVSEDAVPIATFLASSQPAAHHLASSAATSVAVQSAAQQWVLELERDLPLAQGQRAPALPESALAAMESLLGLGATPQLLAAHVTALQTRAEQAEEEAALYTVRCAVQQAMHHAVISCPSESLLQQFDGVAVVQADDFKPRRVVSMQVLGSEPPLGLEGQALVKGLTRSLAELRERETRDACRHTMQMVLAAVVLTAALEEAQQSAATAVVQACEATSAAEAAQLLAESYQAQAAAAEAQLRLSSSIAQQQLAAAKVWADTAQSQREQAATESQQQLLDAGAHASTAESQMQHATQEAQTRLVTAEAQAASVIPGLKQAGKEALRQLTAAKARAEAAESGLGEAGKESQLLVEAADARALAAHCQLEQSAQQSRQLLLAAEARATAAETRMEQEAKQLQRQVEAAQAQATTAQSQLEKAAQQLQQQLLAAESRAAAAETQMQQAATEAQQRLAAAEWQAATAQSQLEHAAQEAQQQLVAAQAHSASIQSQLEQVTQESQQQILAADARVSSAESQTQKSAQESQQQVAAAEALAATAQSQLEKSAQESQQQVATAEALAATAQSQLCAMDEEAAQAKVLKAQMSFVQAGLEDQIAALQEHVRAAQEDISINQAGLAAAYSVPTTFDLQVLGAPIPFQLSDEEAQPVTPRPGSYQRPSHLNMDQLHLQGASNLVADSPFLSPSQPMQVHALLASSDTSPKTYLGQPGAMAALIIMPSTAKMVPTPLCITLSQPLQPLRNSEAGRALDSSPTITTPFSDTPLSACSSASETAPVNVPVQVGVEGPVRQASGGMRVVGRVEAITSQLEDMRALCSPARASMEPGTLEREGKNRLDYSPLQLLGLGRFTPGRKPAVPTIASLRKSFNAAWGSISAGGVSGGLSHRAGSIPAPSTGFRIPDIPLAYGQAGRRPVVPRLVIGSQLASTLVSSGSDVSLPSHVSVALPLSQQ